MSFFNDFLEYFNLEGVTDKTMITFIVGVGLVVVGKIKIENLNDDQIDLKSNKNLIKIFGEDLKIKSVSKGELIIAGEVKSISTGDNI